MAVTNHERVGKALDLLKAGLGPFVERELANAFRERSAAETARLLGDDRLNAKRAVAEWDVAALLKLMWEGWHEVFRRTLGQADRTLVSELREHRNRWAHQEAFSSDDAYRALDSVARLLASVSAPEADEVEKAKMELLRLRFDEQVRSEKRKSAGSAIESAVTGQLKPWREVVNPHRDVASGRYQQAEFAADLWQVHLGEGSDEYRDPVEFFRRTYLTESLSRLLVGAVQRLGGAGGDPVVQLQTNFGGGKTHSMLALFHLFSGVPASDLAGLDDVLRAAQVARLPQARRVVLVGNKISPATPVTKPDGCVVRTLWGELAWQLGGQAAHARVALDDEKATSPGDVLRELFRDYGPCLILIDEWVAYARQLHDQSDLAGGSFETQFTFAQALTESAKLAKNCLLVISLPASDSGASPHAQADDVEVGGQRGREALDRLGNVVGRVESSWRPASAEEGFEIVRRRLFEPLADAAQFKDRDVVARAFADFYRPQESEFPPEARAPDYERRLRAAYPIHPELFDRLYGDWSTLVRFQRTRGVLRLMAAVIHALWEKGDRNPLIMPGHVPIGEPRVQFELTRYLSDNWTPVIEKDLDGPSALPLRLDGEVPNLGKFSACRRVARTIYLGSAPTTTAAHRGLEDRRIKLGCLLPGESPAVFGDALRRLAGAATYLYQDGQRYWYSTQPTVTKLAEDRAEQLKRDPDKVVAEIERRLRFDLRQVGDFSRVHVLPRSSHDVPDDRDARLVVLGTEHAHTRDPNSPALVEARRILETRGNTPRLYQNTLLFLAADRTRLQDLDEAARRLLAWESVLAEQELLDLTPHQVKQAETQREGADKTVAGRMPETFQWLLVPMQASPAAAIEWDAQRTTGTEALAVRISKKVRGSALMVTYGATLLRMELDRVPLWRGHHVPVRQVADDFARYLYLSRLRDSEVLRRAIEDGVNLLAWNPETFAYAEAWDEAEGRYRGLRAQQLVTVDLDGGAVLVKPDVAVRQLAADAAARAGELRPAAPDDESDDARHLPEGHAAPPQEERRVVLRRFHGAVELDATRASRDASRIADEVVTHLVGLVGAKVRVTLEIEAEIPRGAPDNVVRIVTENARTLKFNSQGFEET